MGDYLLGYDIGSSSVKACLLDAAAGKVLASESAPEREMEILAPEPGWAEQHPDIWWENLLAATAMLRETSGANLNKVRAIGISYQMHGLVILDKDLNVLRPSIIWCDSRAVEIGNRAFQDIGKELCLKTLLNSPGNFTASKLKWVMENEPEVFEKIHKIMLPGDYIALKMTGEILTTPSGLSEGIMWDYQKGEPARLILDYYGIPLDFLAPVTPTFSRQGDLIPAAAERLGLARGTPVTYRGGDQPNNALSLKVLDPGDAAATAGTSGVVYGVGDRPNYDNLSRFNTFVHVNHSEKRPRYGNLLCLNGTAILYSWLRRNCMTVGGKGLSYREMDRLASGVPVGSEGLSVLPFGNGAERMLGNRNPGASFHGLDFNRHDRGHLLRAAQEGIVFALKYGLDIMEKAGIPVETVRAGNANMFLSRVFSEAFAAVTGVCVELFNTDGAQGAARGAGIGAGIYGYDNAFAGLESTAVVKPDRSLTVDYEEAYGRWLDCCRKNRDS